MDKYLLKKTFIKAAVKVLPECNPISSISEFRKFDHGKHLIEKACENPYLIEDDYINKVFCSLAYIYQRMSRFDDAIEISKAYKEHVSKRFDECHSYVASSLSNLAFLYKEQGQYQEAEPYYLNALSMRCELLGDDHPDVATSLHDLALLHQSQGRYKVAESFFLQALKIRYERLGNRDLDVATSLNDLASLYQAQGRYQESESYFLQASEMMRELLSDGHPNVASIFAIGDTVTINWEAVGTGTGLAGGADTYDVFYVKSGAETQIVSLLRTSTSSNWPLAFKKPRI